MVIAAVTVISRSREEVSQNIRGYINGNISTLVLSDAPSKMYFLFNIQFIILSSMAASAVENVSMVMPKTGSLGKKTGPFEVCMGTNRVTKASLGKVAKIATSLLAECAFKVISSTHYVWGPDVVDCIPPMVKTFCYAFRVAYDYVSDRPGHIPPEVARNGSVLLDIVSNLLHAYGNEHILGPNICCRNKELKRTSCFPRKPIHDFFTVFLNCGKQSYRNSLPEYFEEITAGAVFGTKKLLNSGVMKFMLG